jgi:[acyl-carrier-protein] S-malonyltransferase
MAAVLGLSGEAVAEVCRKASVAGVVEAVNLNSPGQVVIAGDTAGLKAAGPLAKEAGAKRFIPLPVSAPFHSSLMLPAGERLAGDLTLVNIADPEIPVVANVSADFVRTGPEVKDSLIRQVYSPVRWEESIQRLVSMGIETFVEVGPGRVLSGLIKKISRAVQVHNIEDKTSLEKFLALAGEVS